MTSFIVIASVIVYNKICSRKQIGVILMEKDKVIELAANTLVDEREERIYMRGFQARHLGVSFIIVVLYTLRLIKGNHDNSDLFLILTAQITFVSLHYLNEYRNKMALLASILGTLAMILGFITVLTDYGFIQ